MPAPGGVTKPILEGGLGTRCVRFGLVKGVGRSLQRGPLRFGLFDLESMAEHGLGPVRSGGHYLPPPQPRNSCRRGTPREG